MQTLTARIKAATTVRVQRFNGEWVDLITTSSHCADRAWMKAAASLDCWEDVQLRLVLDAEPTRSHSSLVLAISLLNAA